MGRKYADLLGPNFVGAQIFVVPKFTLGTKFFQARFVYFHPNAFGTQIFVFTELGSKVKIFKLQ